MFLKRVIRSRFSYRCHPWRRTHSWIPELSSVYVRFLRSMVKNAIEWMKHVVLSKDLIYISNILKSEINFIASSTAIGENSNYIFVMFLGSILLIRLVTSLKQIRKDRIYCRFSAHAGSVIVFKILKRVCSVHFARREGVNLSFSIYGLNSRVDLANFVWMAASLVK